MPVEFRILSGARAGQIQRFEQAVIVVGRHQETDLRFDPKSDLDVSGRHAEIRGTEGKYELYDKESTNGTYLNSKKITGSAPLKDGDTITFGAKGPQAEIRIWKDGDAPPMSVSGGRNTEQRIAQAVKKQTKSMQLFMIAALLLIVGGVSGAFYFGRRASEARITELQKQIDASDSLSRMLPQGDTAFAGALERKVTELNSKLESAKTDEERATIQREIEEHQQKLRRMVQMPPTIHTRNSPAVVILISQIEGKNSAGTGFAITKDGLIVTNRHNVQNAIGGPKAGKIAVKFTNTREWLMAKVIKVSEDPDVDLALIQIDHPGHEGPFPIIEGLSKGAESTEGTGVVTIGYPLGYDTPMEGEGNDFEAKSTLNPGTVSKKTSSVLQIDSFAAHGSSGSPVFSTRGLVVGVVYGGQADAGGKIVYAVPPEKLIAFLPPAQKSLVRD
ncbi:MAG TPA: trypsin-like peptidase domain-containing protein [Thermoanaerobaculia bacterium]|nr:trypsin-like peptidase domain-containing protein [Thermoanaerobaculia bacterium]